MTTEPRRIRPWRRAAEAAQAIVVLGLPFVRIRGESALRFDVPTLRLHVFGAVLWMDELFVVLAGTLFVLFAFADGGGWIAFAGKGAGCAMPNE